MHGHGRTVEDTAGLCQCRCKRTDGCKHFSWWPDGGCILQGAVQEYKRLSSGCQNAQGLDGKGNLGALSLNDCKKKCDSHPRCAGFDSIPGGCYLKSKCDGSVGSGYGYKALKPEYRRLSSLCKNAKGLGGDVNLGLSRPDCQKKCDSDHRCAGFDSIPGGCYLKSHCDGLPGSGWHTGYQKIMTDPREIFDFEAAHSPGVTSGPDMCPPSSSIPASLDSWLRTLSVVSFSTKFSSITYGTCPLSMAAWWRCSTSCANKKQCDHDFSKVCMPKRDACIFQLFKSKGKDISGCQECGRVCDSVLEKHKYR